jgi:OmcA/MtrC family decaheme c-type cytochrome
MGQFTNTNGTALVYDFTPSTGTVYKDATTGSAFARDIVTIAACNQCHYRLEYGSNNTSGHFGSRPDTKVCVICHTPQLQGTISATNPAGAGNFTNFIHQIHMGAELPATATPIGIAVNGFGYPQDVRNCVFCHKGADVDNWKTKPTLRSCGSCHNGIVWSTGKGTPLNTAYAAIGHVGGAQTDDKTCSGCHTSAAIAGYHLPIAPPDPSNSLVVYKGAPYNGVFTTYSAAWQAAGRPSSGISPSNANSPASYTVAASLSRLPVGAKSISYVINSVSRNASKQPVMEFKFQVATADASGVLGTPVDVVFNDKTTAKELITGFVGSPSVYWAFSVPQDGIIAPSDYNATISGYLKRIWDGTAATVSGATAAATLTGPVGGYYTVTMTGQTVPDSAKMLTGGIGYTYGSGNAMTKVGSSYAPFASTTIPLTQTDLAAYPYTVVVANVAGIGGLSVPPQNVWKVATGYTGRRVITDNAKCNLCHGRLGVKPTFHAGQRNDAPTCTFCHNVNRTNSGWPVNIKEDVHAIHAAGKLTMKFSWEASAGAKYWTVGYPGVLKNCEQCHVAGFYDFSNSGYTTAFDNMLWTTAVSGTTPATVAFIITGSETVPGTYYAPWVKAGTAYGSTFGYAAATGVTTKAGPNTLVSSPVSSACGSCHDTPRAVAHMQQNGGTILATRASAFNNYSAAPGKPTTPVNVEACLVCHGALSTTNVTNTTTPATKAVHRWW